MAGGVLTALLFHFLNRLGGRHAISNFGRSAFFQWAKRTIAKIKELKYVLKREVCSICSCQAYNRRLN